MVKNGMHPVHAGEILRSAYLLQMGMSVHALSQALRVPVTWLTRYFGTDAQSWLYLQLNYDLKLAEAELKDRIEREEEEMAA